MRWLKALLLPFRFFWWATTFQLGRRIQFRRDYRLIAESGLFDPHFYWGGDDGFGANGVDPLRHYLMCGPPERRDPHPLFDTRWYLSQIQDAAVSDLNPLLHYLRLGWKEGRNPHPLFDGNWYIQQNPDVARSGMNPLVHYTQRGWREGRNPHVLFDTGFYLERNPDVTKAGTEPLSHYVTQGGSDRRDPHPLFDSNWYLGQCQNLNCSGETPLAHYLLRQSAGSPHPLFDAQFYVVRHPDVASSEMTAFMHYMVLGAKRRYNPHPLFDTDFYLDQCSLTDREVINPLDHYVRKGATNGLDPCELFDSSFYLEQYSEVRDAGRNPLAHFWIEGAMNGCNPNPLFHTSFYLKQYPAIAIARVNPLLDFINYGANEGRLPNPFFDPLFYFRNNPDVKNAGRNPLAHYLEMGAKEGRDPSPFFSTVQYVSEHPNLSINPLAHFLGYLNRSYEVSPQQPFSFRLLPEPPTFQGVSHCESITAANEAFRNASEFTCHLLIARGPLTPDAETVGRLIESLSLDPHFGAAIPRQSDPFTGEILKLSNENGDPEITTLPPQVLTEVETQYILPEILSSCFVLRDSVITNVGCLDETYETLAGALQQYLCKARRCGFRCIVANNAVVSAASDNSSWLVSVGRGDLIRAHTEYPDIGEAKIQFMNHPLHRHESLLARALSTNRSVRQTLLIDARGVPNRVNGTTEAVLGICDGLRQINSSWSITLWVARDAANHHNLPERYPDWEILEEISDRFFTAVLRPSQPWDLNSLIELHRKALFCFYTILDTIAWDILFVAPAGLSAAWNFLSSHADGILYISRYTRDRFFVRFPQAQNIPGYVSYLSLNPRDYKCQAANMGVRTDSGYILIVGNNYDHKDVGPTADLLAAKFPDNRIKAFGIKKHASPSVECLESGQLRQPDVNALFASAMVVIFPSFYEGFGFPVLRGLSNGCIVIARHSELLTEVAGRYRGPGRLMGFHNPKELLEAVERVISGSEIHELPLGSELNSNDEPPDWKSVASGVLRFIEERIQHVDQCRWYARQMAIEQIECYTR